MGAEGRVQLRQELLERQQQLQHPVSRLIGLSSQLCLLDLPQVPKISGTNAQAKGISFLAAWKIPGVAGFALILFFAKLVAYTFLYWLPFYLSMGMGPAQSCRLRPPVTCQCCLTWVACWEALLPACCQTGLVPTPASAAALC